MKWMKQMGILIAAGVLFLSACQGNAGPATQPETTGTTQPTVTGVTQPGTTGVTQPAITGSTLPATTPMTQPVTIPMTQPVTTPSTTTDPPGAPVVEGLGVINANLTWGSSFVISGNWIYGIDNSGQETSIIKMKRDGSQQTVVAQKNARHLNLIGDWLYFVDGQPNYCIARMKTDGSGYGVIHDGSVFGIIVRDNWIYFIDSEKENQIHKIKTDGTGSTKLSDGPATGLRLDGEWLYWSTSINDHFESEDIYRTRLDGSAEERLIEENIQGMNVAEGYVYYGHSEDRSKTMGISRMKVDGTEQENILPEFAISLIGVYKGRLYYYDRIDEMELFRAELDGSKPERLIDFGEFSEIHFLDDQILFFEPGRSKFRMMDLDGTNVRDMKISGSS